MRVILACFLIFSFFTLVSCAKNSADKNNSQDARRLNSTEFLLKEPLSEQKERKQLLNPRRSPDSPYYNRGFQL